MCLERKYTMQFERKYICNVGIKGDNQQMYECKMQSTNIK